MHRETSRKQAGRFQLQLFYRAFDNEEKILNNVNNSLYNQSFNEVTQYELKYLLTRH